MIRDVVPAAVERPLDKSSLLANPASTPSKALIEAPCSSSIAATGPQDRIHAGITESGPEPF
ncbi:MAG TPA: hypothetical protein VII33_09450, partial [Nakamurella sp.]